MNREKEHLGGLQTFAFGRSYERCFLGCVHSLLICMLPFGGSISAVWEVNPVIREVLHEINSLITDRTFNIGLIVRSTDLVSSRNLHPKLMS